MMFVTVSTLSSSVDAHPCLPKPLKWYYRVLLLTDLLPQAASRNQETREIAEDHVPVARMMSRCSAYAELYLGNSTLGTESKRILRLELLDLYKAILVYLVRS